MGYYPQGGPVQQPQQGYYQTPGQGYYQTPQQGYYRQPQQPATGPAPGQRYQIPAQFAGTAPGSVIAYGGADYVVGNDGTMTSSAFTAQSTASTPAAPGGVVAGQRYQIPAELAGTPPGTMITYGGRNYLTGNDGTMTFSPDPAAR